MVESNGLTTITVSGEANVGTTFMRVIGIDEIDVASAIEVTQETEGLELVLVLDVTGSMEGSKIAALRQASRDLIELLFGDDTEKEFLKVDRKSDRQGQGVSVRLELGGRLLYKK